MAKAFLVVLPDEIDIFGDGDMGHSGDWLYGTLQNELEHFHIQEISRWHDSRIQEAIDDLQAALEEE
jgi:hypothetical protein